MKKQNILTITEIVALLVFFILLAVISTHPISSDDLWYHLNTGKYIIKNHTIPHKEIFSHTMEGKPYITHEWLTQVLFYIVYLISGIDGLVIFRTIIVALPFLIFYILLRKEKISSWLIVMILSSTLFVITTRAFVRPHIFTYLFLSLVLYILYRYRSGEVKRLYMLPVIFLIWANVHSGILFGFLALMVFVVVEWFKYLLRKVKYFSERGVMERGKLKRLSLYGLISVVVSFINPHFHKALFYPFYLISAEKYMFTIRELMHTPLSDVYSGALFIYFFWGIIVWGGLMLLLNIKRIDFVNLVLFAITAFLSFKAGRNTVIFALFAIPVLAFETDVFVNTIKRKKVSRKKKQVEDSGFRYGALIVNVVLAIILLLSSYHFYNSGMSLGEGKYRRFSSGIYPGIFPVNACDFIIREDISGKMFNSFNEGGYIAWRLYPEEQNFIDSRLLVFEDLYPEYVDVYWTGDGFEDILNRYDIDYFLLYYPPMGLGDDFKRTIHSYLFESEEWKLVFWDDAGIIYLKNIEKFRHIIKKYEYKHYNPAELSIEATKRYYKMNPDEVMGEVKRAVEQNECGYHPRMVLGYIYELQKEWQSAEEQYEKATEIDPYNKRAFQRLGEVYRNQHKLEKSLESFIRAKEISSEDATIYNDLGITYAMMEKYEKAREMWEKALEIDPDYYPPRDNLEKLKEMGY